MLTSYWRYDAALELVATHERSNRRRFDWIALIRPDLACGAPLPQLALLPRDRVYTTMKEGGKMFDTIVLLPVTLVVPFRTAAMRVSKSPRPGDCMSGRQTEPERALWVDLRHSRVAFERLPLPCAIARQDPYRTAVECRYRLQSHHFCSSLYPHRSEDAWVCSDEDPHRSESARLRVSNEESRHVARAVCADLCATLYAPKTSKSVSNVKIVIKRPKFFMEQLGST